MNELVKKYVPKKYQERVKSIELEGGLTDGCKYMLYMNDGWLACGEYTCVPVFSIKEAIDIIKDSLKEGE